MIGIKKYKNSKYLVIACLVIILTLLIAGCGKKEEIIEESDEQPIQIGVSFDSFVIERWERDRDVFVSACKDRGAEVLVQVADGDVDEQIDQIRYFIDKKVDAIVVIAVDCNTLSEVVKEAKDAGIYVISYDRLIMNADSDLLITFDNKMVGQLMGETILTDVKPFGRIICINGSDSDHNVTEVQEGFHSVVDGTNLRIIYNDYCPNWDSEAAYEHMQNILDSNIKFEGIMCGNDDLATVVSKALSERGMADGVVIVGQDADLAACQRIVNGMQAMTVYKSVESLAREAANDTLELIEKGEIETEQTVNNGRKDVPAVLLKPVAVTEKNMDTVIIGGGFHQYSEIYGKQE